MKTTSIVSTVVDGSKIARITMTPLQKKHMVMDEPVTVSDGLKAGILENCAKRMDEMISEIIKAHKETK